MEQFFIPTRSDLQDLCEEQENLGVFEYEEVQLAVPVEEFLNYHWDWEDLLAFLTGGVTPKLGWVTETAFLVVKESGNLFHLIHGALKARIEANIQSTSGQEQTLILVSTTHLSPISAETVGVFWRAITTSNTHQLRIRNMMIPLGPLLSQVLRKTPSLQVIEFWGFHFGEEHCRDLATIERSDLELKLHQCSLEPQDLKNTRASFTTTTKTFIEWFRHNQVLTELDCCPMGSPIICALNGNNSVKKLTIERLSGGCVIKMRSLAYALPGNMGIEHLCLTSNELCDVTWILLFRLLSTHPRIKLLSLSKTWTHLPLSAGSKTTRMNAVIQMLQGNTVVRIIELPDAHIDEELYQNSILPRLEMNRSCFEVQRQAVKRADPSIRPQLFGRALHAVRYNPNLVYQFLSENVPAFVRTEEDPTILLS
jgi:hypothetical protein